jgi:hypothetical protein
MSLTSRRNAEIWGRPRCCGGPRGTRFAIGRLTVDLKLAGPKPDDTPRRSSAGTTSLLRWKFCTQPSHIASGSSTWAHLQMLDQITQFRRRFLAIDVGQIAEFCPPPESHWISRLNRSLSSQKSLQDSSGHSRATLQLKILRTNRVRFFPRPAKRPVRTKN